MEDLKSEEEITKIEPIFSQNTHDFEKLVRTHVRRTSSNFKTLRKKLENPQFGFVFSTHLGVLKSEEFSYSCLNYYIPILFILKRVKLVDMNLINKMVL